ncbi:sialidase family protein [Actinophytocola sp.]|uniref:sialidase family protein n=1 Tax=Actinophytocola sp. TaxID=1872138 RepID=UPI002EDA2860
MPDLDLDAELGRLRDGIRQSVHVPDFDRVVERSRQRVVRRRMQIGAVAAVLAVSAAVPLLRAGTAPDPIRPATPPPATAPTVPTRITEPFVHDVEFADRDHGYALRANCKDEPAPQECPQTLLSTDDGGAHWASHPVPKQQSLPKGVLGRLLVLGRDKVGVDWFVLDVNSQANRIYSDDGGRTWRQVELFPVVTDTVPAIPDDSTLVVGCEKLVGGGNHCAETAVAAVLPDSGRSALLANQPPLIEVQPGRIPLADGRWWVVGRRPGTRTWAIAVSDDKGRGWITGALDLQGTPYPDGWSVVASGDTLYASAHGRHVGDSGGMLAVLRSDDGGRSWARTWRWDEHATPQETLGTLVALPDGSVMINAKGGKGRTFVSEDGGHTFTEVARRYTGSASWTRIGYLAWPPGKPWDAFQFSRDGTGWQDLKIK